MWEPCKYISSICGLCVRSDSAPGGQAVSERWQVDWSTVLVSSFGAVLLRLDGRGSGFKGTNLLHHIHRRLGVMEERDHMEALRYALHDQ